MIEDSTDIRSMDKPPFTWVSPILCVNDLSKSLGHYRDVLGFDVAWSWSQERAFEQPEHPTFACVCRGEVSLFLCEQGQGHPGAWVVFNVASAAEVDRVHEEFRQSGARILEEPQDRSWGLREMHVEDLDGNTLRIGAVIDIED